MDDYKDSHPHDHHDEHSAHHSHNHTHGAIDPGILDTQQGIAAIKWSLLVLLVTALVVSIQSSLMRSERP